MRITIIGAGPGGYETAVEAAKHGVEVVLVSEGPLGGTCLNEGCIPTKTFCTAAGSGQSLKEAFERKNAVVAQLQGGIGILLKNKLITLVSGHASFIDARTVEVAGERYVSDAVIIATGSVPAFLPIPGAHLPGVLTSTEILDLQEAPKRLCVIGGGVIGLEFASIFNYLGTEVTVLEYCPNVLPRFDVDMCKRLKQALSRRGISIETSAQVTAIEEGMKVRYLKKDKELDVEADMVLMAVGRRANLSSLNLDAVGIECTKRGIAVDGNMMTNVPGIYAIGDITGGMMLAHVATFQGIRALNHILGEKDSIDFGIVPAAVFTVPELACVGLTEEDCEQKGIAVNVGKSFYRANGKAVSMGETDGICKIISDAATGKILGCHIMGAHASDIVHEAAILMNCGATLQQAGNMIFAHPTLSEVLRSAL